MDVDEDAPRTAEDLARRALDLQRRITAAEEEQRDLAPKLRKAVAQLRDHHWSYRKIGDHIGVDRSRAYQLAREHSQPRTSRTDHEASA